MQPNNIYIHIHTQNYMADIFTKQVYRKVYLTFGLKSMMRKLEKDNSLEVLEISVLFSYRKIDKQLLVLFEYLTVSLDINK